jgi:hypothetical protein
MDLVPLKAATLTVDKASKPTETTPQFNLRQTSLKARVIKLIHCSSENPPSLHFASKGVHNSQSHCTSCPQCSATDRCTLDNLKSQTVKKDV